MSLLRTSEVYLLRSREGSSVNRSLVGAQRAAERMNRRRVGSMRRLDWAPVLGSPGVLSAEDGGYVYRVELVPLGE